jgi:integrase
MDRGGLASFLYSAERTSRMHAALAVLLGLNGLRVSEVCGANVEDLGFERGARYRARVATPGVRLRRQPRTET